MSIALESSRGRIEGSRLIRPISLCTSIFVDPLDPSGWNIPETDPRFPPVDKTSTMADEDEEASCSSSIGRNSDSRDGHCSRSDDEDSVEVQSSYKGPLDTMDALEESLPVRQGISKFYDGKSKSFTSLADAATAACAKELAKPENAYNRKRKNLLAVSNYLEKNRASLMRSTAGCIAKRPTNASKTTLALAIAMNSSENSNSDEHEPQRPPLHPQGKSAMSLSPSKLPFSSRSFSLSDLQGASSGMILCPTDNHKKFC